MTVKLKCEGRNKGLPQKRKAQKLIRKIKG